MARSSRRTARSRWSATATPVTTVSRTTQHNRYISRYNIWERNHYYTEPGSMTGAVACTIDDDCRRTAWSARTASRTSRACRTATRTTTSARFPSRIASQKPIVWHYAEGSARIYFDSNREAAEEWDTAMRGAVRGREVRRVPALHARTRTAETVITGNFAGRRGRALPREGDQRVQAR